MPPTSQTTLPDTTRHDARGIPRNDRWANQRNQLKQRGFYVDVDCVMPPDVHG